MTDLDDLLGRFVDDLGATIGAGNVLLGDRLGLYRAMAAAGPLTAAELATRTGTAERYVREWLPGQAAAGYVTYDGATYSLTEAQELAFAAPDGLGLPGVHERLTGGIAVADVGCGLGASTRILAETYPASTVTGFDPHVESIDLARKAGEGNYSFSTFLCVPHAVSEGAADALGNQAGEVATRAVVEAAGFGTFQRVAETPFNLIYEVRP